MKLLLDEMWTHAIAAALRKRGFDVIASNEPAHAERYGGVADDEVFARAQADALVVVTDNVADFEKARLDWGARGTTHHGVVYALDPPFNRHRGDVVIGQMVNALAAFLGSRQAEETLLDSVHYLRPADDVT